MAGNEITNIQVYRKKWNMNIGIIVFVLIFIYLVVTVLMYLTGKHISAYEVREGSILKDTAYTGFVVRQETVITSDADGYVNYFAPEGTKVGAKTNIYTLSSNKLSFEIPADEETASLTSDEQASLLVKEQSFSENFHEDRFSEVYALRTSISSVLENKSSQSRYHQLETMLNSGEDELQIHKAARDGIIIYSTDGYEGIALEDITPETVSKSQYKKVDFSDNSNISAGEPVYKLITDNSWTVVISLDKKTAQSMMDQKSVKVRFTKDNETAWADFTVYNTKDGDLGFLTFRDSMIRYAKERYLDVELILEDQSGLKIPKSSVINKEFYVIEEEYLTQGGNSEGTGILIDKGDGNAKFQKVDVSYRDSEKQQAYLDMDSLDAGTVLLKPDSAETYSLNKTKKLKGVYNINKGYAVFRRVKILSESEEYYIVESGNDYSLSNYDHIALDGDSVRENNVVF